MKNSGQPRYVLGIDPSGNFYEGKGTTGWCVFDIVKTRCECSSLYASRAKSQEAYCRHVVLINNMFVKYKAKGIAVSMEDYVLASLAKHK